MLLSVAKKVALLGATFSIISACSSKNTETKEQGNASKKLKIAVIPKGTTHSYWQAVKAGAIQAGEDLGVEISFQGPQKEDDRQMQIQVVQNFISRQVDAIVLSPLDDRSLVQPVKEAVRNGIPVVIIDSDLNSKEHSSFVATDNYAGGKLCAERMKTLLNGKGKILMLRYQEGSASTLKREAGFEEAIKAIAPGIELINNRQYAGATIEKAFQVAQNLINRHGDIDGVFCSNESTTQGMLRALQTAGKAGKLKFVGFDASPTLVAALKAGEIQGLAVQNPYKMGYEGVKTAVAVIKKQSFEKQIDTGVLMVTGENINTEEVRKLVN